MLSCRSLKDSVFKIGFFSNKTVFIGIGAVLALQALFIYAPPMQAIFSTFPLTLQSLLFSALAGAIILPVISVEKVIRNRRRA